MEHNKPIFLLLIGVEGSGHHLTLAFLKQFFIKQKVVSLQKWLPSLSSRWDALEPIQTKVPTSFKNRQQYISEIKKTIDNSPQVQFIYTSASFPYGLERDTLRRPDIIDMVELLSPYVDLRPLVIYRDPVSCTYSAIRRGFNQNALHQARIVEDNLIFIKQQLETCGLEFRTINYERFVSNPDAYAAGYKQWWSIDDKSFSAGINQIRPSTSKKQIPPGILEILEAFFSPLRTKQWEEFLQKNDIINL